MQLILTLLALAATCHGQSPPLFPYEKAEITLDEIEAFRDVGLADSTTVTTAECKAFPGTPEWPTDDEWKRFNASLGGVLLKPVPAGAVCYPGPYQDAAKCTALVNNQVISKGHFDDPLGISTAWTSGNPCPAVEKPTGECTQGGLPVYVVNATSVKHIQMAVNFARNKNLRLVVKNTGHDFLGRSTGAGALSVWTHHLKSFDLLPDFVQGPFRGNAAHVGVGLEAWEVHELMAKYNITLVAPSFSTLGAFGGFMTGGGHSSLVSYHGLASDQVLAMSVVTPDGSFMPASPSINPDLFFSLRGGGASTWGIITSVVVKAHPPVNITTTDIAFSSLETGTDLFWKAISTYFSFGGTIVDAAGIDRTYINPLSNATVFNFTSKFEFPGLTPQGLSTLLAPLATSLRALGVNVTIAQPTTAPWADSVLGEGAPLRDQRFASRLIPRAVWDDPTKFAAAMAALRSIAEGGYQVHGTHMAPTYKVAGYPGYDSAANPAFRTAVMHAVVYDLAPSTTSPGVTALADRAARARLSTYMDYLRNVTAGSGSYLNEADVLEPNWQQSFFGANYQQLHDFKGFRDPWGVLWAPGTVGSEEWAVRTAGGVPTQNGRLCRTGS